MLSPPSGRRVIALREPVWTPGYSLLTPPIDEWLAKDVGLVSVRAMDFSDILYGRAIIEADIGVLNVNLVDQSVSGNVVNVVLAGGTAGLTAQVQITAQCDDTSQELGIASLPIVSQMFTTPAPPTPLSSNVIQTAGTTPGVIGPLVIPATAGNTVSLHGRVVARRIDDGSNASVEWSVSAVIENYSLSNAAVVQMNVTPYRMDPAMVGASLTLSVAGSAISLVIIGISGASIKWGSGFNVVTV